METILIVDDEKNYPRILSAVLEEEGFETFCANSGYEAFEILKNIDVDLVLTDMKMPKMDGIELLEKIKDKDKELPVIMMTAYGTVDKAVEAIQKGAYSYILKPFDNNRLILYVNKAIGMYRMVKENRQLRNAVESKYSFGNIIGKSKVMKDVVVSNDKDLKKYLDRNNIEHHTGKAVYGIRLLSFRCFKRINHSCNDYGEHSWKLVLCLLAALTC